MAKRTQAGTVTQEEREKSGIGNTGKFPVFDRKSALSAIRLRHHGKGISASRVLDAVARWARKNNDQLVLDKVAEARAKDKGGGRA